MQSATWWIVLRKAHWLEKGWEALC